jgi:acyl-CoA thioesterase I
MSPVALYFASGESLYPGAILLILTVSLSLHLEQGWLARLRNTTAWLSFAMIVMASVPVPWWGYLLLLGLYSAWYMAANRRSQPTGVQLTLKATFAAALSSALIIIVVVELPHRNMPHIAGQPTPCVAVLGDSISAGFASAGSSWPAILEQKTGVAVKNLSQPGAHVIDGVGMATKLSVQDRLVMIELGGNDLLQGSSTHEFEQALEKLLSVAAVPGRTVAMFELPLLPHKIAYGQVQRRLANKHGVTLIPKRLFSEILSSTKSTTDGLHLSMIGSQRMAALVTGLFAPLLKPQ